jgi:arsenite methyltransferase
MTAERDHWHRWLLGVRYGGDPAERERLLTETLYPVRDDVLDGAELRPDDTVLDVGAGDGLIAFGALDRLGPAGRVIFCDVSRDLLDHCRDAAEAAGQLARCDFVLAPADRLAGVPDDSVDVVTTRSVLIYVKDKAAAFAEFRRVLRPGGRISVSEPINRLMHERDANNFSGYDVTPVAALAEKVKARFREIQPDGQNPMLDFDDRDLLRLAEQAGFTDVTMHLRVTVKSARVPVPWDRFLRMSGNPLVPPLAEVLDRALTPAELAEFSAHLRPLVEAGTGRRKLAIARLTATASEPAAA